MGAAQLIERPFFEFVDFVASGNLLAHPSRLIVFSNGLESLPG